MQIFVANWKMHKTRPQAKAFLQALAPRIKNYPNAEIWIAPPFTALAELSANSSIKRGAQNFYPADQGAFTGEISAEMLKDVGVEFILIGHSERRTLFQETDALIHLKVKAALKHDLLPILCVGESLKEREAKEAFSVIENQIRQALKEVPPTKIVLAYEPVWAIGTGKSATVQMASEMHAYCRSILEKMWGQEWALKTPILYGGSVNQDNAKEFLKNPEIQGVLVGGASLEVEKFIQIIQGGV